MGCSFEELAGKAGNCYNHCHSNRLPFFMGAMGTQGQWLPSVLSTLPFLLLRLGRGGDCKLTNTAW